VSSAQNSLAESSTFAGNIQFVFVSVMCKYSVMGGKLKRNKGTFMIRGNTKNQETTDESKNMKYTVQSRVCMI
jgi:hypothetical protein